MKRIISCIITSIVISTSLANSQVLQENKSQALGKLFGRLINNFDDNDRVRINDSIKLIIDKYVESDTVFNHRFTNIRYLGQITSSDSLIKIINWNLVLRSGNSMYFCYIVRKMISGDGNRIYRLTASYKEDPVIRDTVYTGSDWYGALYYDIRPYKINNTDVWVLLGIDYGNPFITRKIIDVLSFLPDDKLIFGKKWFVSNGIYKYRDVLEYASNGMMSLRFRSDSLIVFDHLVPFSSSQTGDRQYYGPDYSYDAYILEDGSWSLNINIDARNKE